MINHFDEIIDRTAIATLKYDSKTMQKIFGSDKLWPSWVADMDFKASPEIIEALQQRLDHGVFGYEVDREEISEAVSQWHQKRQGWSFASEQIIFTPRTLNSLATLIDLFSDKGDGVIIQPPVFYDFKLIINSNKRKIVKNPLQLENGRYFIDFDNLEARAADPSNKLLILCNPHNPIGRVWTRNELQKISDICIKHSVFIISDEIHGDITYDGGYTPLASLSEEAAKNSAVCISLIKSFNLAGVGNSMIVIADKEKRNICANWYKRMQINKNNVFTNAATLAAYTKGEPWLDKLTSYLKINIEEICNRLRNNIPQLKLIEPDGTYLVWLDFRELKLSTKQLENFLIQDAKVAANPGHWFGREGAGFARINIACPRSILQSGLKQLEHAIEQLSHKNQV